MEKQGIVELVKGHRHLYRLNSFFLLAGKGGMRSRMFVASKSGEATEASTLGRITTPGRLDSQPAKNLILLLLVLCLTEGVGARKSV